VKNQTIIVIVLLIIVFLAGFVPQYIHVKRLENDLSAAKQENALAQLRDLAGLAFVQASQKNYGLAAGTSHQFFSQAREMANRASDRKQASSPKLAKAIADSRRSTADRRRFCDDLEICLIEEIERGLKSSSVGQRKKASQAAGRGPALRLPGFICALSR
jgi:hypothetical protein